jgi:hypothetical protein
MALARRSRSCAGAAPGWTRLLGLDAFHAERVTMAVFTTTGAAPAAEIALKVP